MFQAIEMKGTTAVKKAITPTIIKIELIGRIARYEENINVMYMNEGIRNGEKNPEINLAIAFNITTTTPFLVLQ